MQSNEALFEAVEHQQLDLAQLLLSQYGSEELDLNTPNSEGLLPLDIAVMTNNAPMAKLLLRAGAKESPHCESGNFAHPSRRVGVQLPAVGVRSLLLSFNLSLKLAAIAFDWC